ncbi:MAG: hypothetical protein QOD99_2291 [Chthoniobacter sp.]|nr:hypothetical protein [Chthoniobacter sp.]
MRPLEQFHSHWTLVDRVLAESGPLLVLDGIGREVLISIREELETMPTGLLEVLAEEKLATGRLRQLKARQCERMKLFNLRVRGDYPRTVWETVLRLVPNPEVSMARWLRPVRETLCLWKRLDEATGGFELGLEAAGTRYSSAGFEQDFEETEAAWEAWSDCEVETALLRVARTFLQARAVAVMKAYGHAVQGRLGDGSALVASLPQLWPGPRRGQRRKRRTRASRRPAEGAASDLVLESKTLS